MTVYNMFSILISISSSKRVVRLKRIVNPKFTHHKAIQVVYDFLSSAKEKVSPEFVSI